MATGAALGFAAAAFVLTLVTRVATLGRQSLWFDEIITAETVAMGWRDLVDNRLGQGHFPTYFALLKALGLSGASDMLLRLPSALFSAIAAAILAALAFRLGGRIAALAAALMFAFIPNLFFYGQEARPYAMLLVFIAITMAAQIAMLGPARPARRTSGIATVGAVGAALTIPAGIVSVLAQHLALFVAGAARRGQPARAAIFRHIAISWAIIALAALALVPAVFHIAHEPRGLMKWQAQAAPLARVLQAWRETYGFWVSEDVQLFLPARWEAIPSFAFCALALAAVVLGRHRPAIRFLAATVVLTILLYGVLGIFTATAGRYMIGILPATILLAACGAAEILKRSRYRAAWSAAFIGLAAMLALQMLDASASDARYDWRRVARFIESNDLGGIELLGNNNLTRRSLGHYLPPAATVRFRLTTPGVEPPGTLWQWARESDPAWLLLFYTVDRLPEDVVAGRSVCRWNFGLANLFVVTRNPSELPPSLRGCTG